MYNFVVFQKQVQWNVVVRYCKISFGNAKFQKALKDIFNVFFEETDRIVDGRENSICNITPTYTFIIDENGSFIDQAYFEKFRIDAWLNAIHRFKIKVNNGWVPKPPKLLYHTVYHAMNSKEPKARKTVTTASGDKTVSKRYLLGTINGRVIYKSGSVQFARIRTKDDRGMVEPVDGNWAAINIDAHYLTPVIDLNKIPQECYTRLNHGNQKNVETIRSFNFQ